MPQGAIRSSSASSVLRAAALVAILSLGAALLAAQGLPEGAAASSGPSGLKWVGGNRESPFMNPGLSCISCHSKGEGPRFAAAGTVYTKLDEKDLEFGVEGAVVQITDSKGQVVQLTTNKAGNFFANRVTFSFPITAKVLYKGKERAMASPQSSGNCPLCHTAKGQGGAPGRVIIP